MVASVVALLLVALGIGGAYVLQKRRAAEDVRGSSTEEFVVTEEPAEEPPPPPKPPQQAEARGRLADLWLRRGTPTGRRVRTPPALPAHLDVQGAQPARVPTGDRLRPALLLEQLRDDVRRQREDRQARLEAPIGRCVAASPAVHGHTVFQSFLNAPPCNSERNRRPARGRGDRVRGGLREDPLADAARADRVVAARRERARLRRRLARPRLRARRADGSRPLDVPGQGRIKGAVSLSGNRLYAGTYEGYLYALNPATGKLIWRTRSQDRLGGRGQFYSTPALAYGRVYIGSTDGKVYSFGATTGKLIWSQGTGGFVYSSPATWRKKVYAGSYSGRFVALDAATGDTVWSSARTGRSPARRP